MLTILSTFLEQKLWIDIIIVCVLLWMVYLSIIRTSHRQIAENREYNASLLALRTQIYTEYERDFFL